MIRISSLRLKHTFVTICVNLCHTINDKNLKSEIETYHCADGADIKWLTINDKNLKSEIETATRFGVPSSLMARSMIRISSLRLKPSAQSDGVKRSEERSMIRISSLRLKLKNVIFILETTGTINDKNLKSEIETSTSSVRCYPQKHDQ